MLKGVDSTLRSSFRACVFVILDQTMSGANWTSQDTMNLRRLLMKAQEQGVPITELAAEVEDPSLATSWDFSGG